MSLKSMAVPLSELKFPYKFGNVDLMPSIIQNSASGLVLSLFYTDAEAIAKSLDDGYVWRYSREHNRIMKKGEESGNTQKIVDVAVNRNRDSVLMKVVPAGPACHLGYESCFFTQPLQDLKFSYRLGNEQLIPVIAQDLVTKGVLDLSYMNREALRKTKQTEMLWVYENGVVRRKGEKSGMLIIDICPDCDKDAILAGVIPESAARFENDGFENEFYFTENLV